MKVDITKKNENILRAKLLRQSLGSVARLVTCAVNCKYAVAGISTSSSFEVQFFDMMLDDNKVNNNSMNSIVTNEKDVRNLPSPAGIGEIKGVGASVTLPEPCHHIALLTTQSNSDTLDIDTLIPTSNCSGNANNQREGQEYDELSEGKNPDQNKPQLHWTAVGLSQRHRLYCGEVLLMAGASSFTVNTALDILSYITLGTRPALHHMSISALVGLSSLQGQHIEEQYFLECGEPRPVERGAKLITCVSAEARTVIQLPRGNLEVFEPRTLVLMKARILLQKNQLVECLIMLRRQKVDLNYIVDYDPSIFLINVKQFVQQLIVIDSEYLSLFLSSLEPGNTSVFKYPIAIVGSKNDHNNKNSSIFTIRSPATLIAEGVTLQEMAGPRKLEVVCQAVRRELQQLLLLHEQNSHNKNDVLHPLLCTYAKQRPPLLEEALECLSHQFFGIHNPNTSLTPTTATTGMGSNISQENKSKRAAILSSHKAQSSLKYLAFLAEGSKLFDAALGMCDFAMARAVARQCQMDPKVYMKLLERFEAITATNTPFDTNIVGITTCDNRNSTSSFSMDESMWLKLDSQFRHHLMHFEVNLHLNRSMLCIEAGVAALTIKLQLESQTQQSLISSSSSSTLLRTEDSICDCLYKLMIDNALHRETLSLLSKVFLSYTALHTSMNKNKQIKTNTTITSMVDPSLSNATTTTTTSSATTTSTSTLSKMKHLINRLRKSYGLLCQSKQQYSEALTAFLLTDPPSFTEAITIARLDADWRLTLTLVGRKAISENEDPVPKVKRVAAEIVSMFRENLEQGDTEADDHSTHSIIPSYLLSSTESNGSSSNNENNSMYIHMTNTSNEVINHSNASTSSSNTITDRAMEAAQISLDYLEDVESAIGILLAARKWSCAIEICIRTNRRDLLNEEVAVTIREATVNLIQLLPKISLRQQALVEEIKAIWNQPEERLIKLMELDPESFVENKDGRKPNDTAMDDNKSEFSVSSHLSQVSYVSHISYVSNTTIGTNQSIQSGTSAAVSVLSNLLFDKDSGGNHQKSHHHHNSNNNNFSIAGLDHSLLSRGTHSEWEKQHPGQLQLNKGGQIKTKSIASSTTLTKTLSEREREGGDDDHSNGHQRGGEGGESKKFDKAYHSKISEKRQKKHDRKKGVRNLGADSMGILNEKKICMELWNIAQLKQIIQEVKHLCDVLLILNETQSYPLNSWNQCLLTDRVLSLASSSNDTMPPFTTTKIDIMDTTLAILLQNATNENAMCLKQFIPPLAPKYPYHFLEKKQLLIFARFQDQIHTNTSTISTINNPHQNQDDDNMISIQQLQQQQQLMMMGINGGVVPPKMKTWWEAAAEGILSWERIRKSTLNI